MLYNCQGSVWLILSPSVTTRPFPVPSDTPDTRKQRGPDPTVEALRRGERPTYVTEAGAAYHTGYSKAWFKKRRRLGQAPPFVRIDRGVRYPLLDLDAFLNLHRVDP